MSFSYKSFVKFSVKKNLEPKHDPVIITRFLTNLAIESMLKNVMYQTTMHSFESASKMRAS